jgi:outer membrane protein TolC
MRGVVSKFLVILGTATLVTACAVGPKPITEAERAKRAIDDLEQMFGDQDPLDGPISLSEAISRAIKFNLDHRVKLMEKAVVRAEAELARMDLLPAITADAGYTTRSNVAASSSQSIITGRESLEPSTSQEETRALANLNLVWNVLDFGVSYVTAQQRADRILIAEEKRRKAVQNIVQDVRVAYWNALSADRLTQETDNLLSETQLALKESEAMEAEGIQTPLTSMQYQEGLLATLRTLWQLRQRLNTAKAELASLMNVRPGTDFVLAPDQIDQTLPEINTVVPELEEFGLLHRPELIEEDYRLQIDSAEIRKAMLRMLPGLEINVGAHYDSNDFLVNNDWADAGLRISWNLFNIFRGNREKELAEAQVELDEARRLATGMAVLTQINVAHQRYNNAWQDYQLSENLLDVKTEISDQERGRFQAQVSDELSLIRTRLDRLVAQMQRDLALAELQNAAGRVHNSIGLDPLPEQVPDHELETLTLAVATQQRSLHQMLAKPQLDPNMYDEIAREIAMARAQERREQALKDKQTAEGALAEAARQKALKEEEAARAAEAAVAVQRQAIEAAITESDAKRAAVAKTAAEMELLVQKQQEAEAARKAAEEAAAQAAALAEAAAAAEEEARRAADVRQAELDRIAETVQNQINEAVEAALLAGEAREQAQEALKDVQDAERRVDDIIIPEVPEIDETAPAEGTDSADAGSSAPPGPNIKPEYDARKRTESERIAAELAKLAKLERAEAERIATGEAETERAKAERIAAARVARERAEAERLAAQQAAWERAESERIAAEQAARERADAEHIAAEQAAARERAEAERIAAEEAARERAQAERLAVEQAARERAEAQRIAAEEAARERAEGERIAAAQAAADQAEAERIAAERQQAKEQARAERAAARRAAAKQAQGKQADVKIARAEQRRAEQDQSGVEQAEAEQVESDQPQVKDQARQANAGRIAEQEQVGSVTASSEKQVGPANPGSREWRTFEVAPASQPDSPPQPQPQVENVALPEDESAPPDAEDILYTQIGIEAQRMGNVVFPHPGTGGFLFGRDAGFVEDNTVAVESNSEEIRNLFRSSGR